MAQRPRPPRRPTLIVNALGGLDDPNIQGETGERFISDRIIADARASGLTAVNVDDGLCRRAMASRSSRACARSAAGTRGCAGRPNDLMKVLSAADILRAAAREQDRHHLRLPECGA